ncbi:hypothetical protein [Hyphomonas oceanitis]|uniref:hypothetical protein n=1 Tax=Hyphomonas oceanitis TaxID=81033 RepID=UPI0030037FDB
MRKMNESEPPVVEPLPPPAEPAPPPKPVKEPPRPILKRLFGIGVWGWIKLVALCILVGFIVLASNFDPSSPDVDIPAAIGAIVRQTLAAAGWALQNFWKPALAGAGIVLPVWILWRLVSLPFRK